MLISDLLASERITGTVSELRFPKTRIQNFLGTNVGGRASQRANGGTGGHETSYDVFNTTRDLPHLMARATGPRTNQLSPMARVRHTMLRVYESRPLDYDKIWHNRAIGSNPGTIDVGGQQYIAKQERNLAQIMVNMREFAAAMMLRGSMGVLQATASQIPVLPGAGTRDIDFGISAGHKGQAGGIITASWATAGTKIVDHILALRAKAEEDTGYTLEHALINSKTWGYLVNNTQVQTLAGTASQPWDKSERVVDRGPDNEPVNEWVATLRAIPDLMFHISDHGLDVWDGSANTFAKMIPDDHIIFTPEPDGTWNELHEGSEPVKDDASSPVVERFGLYAYKAETVRPTGVNIDMLDNFLPVLTVPDAIWFLKVANF